MSATLHDDPPEPTGYVVGIPGGKAGTHWLSVGPFETRQAAEDFADEFLMRVEIQGDGLLVGPTYSPAFILSVVLDTQERKQNG